MATATSTKWAIKWKLDYATYRPKKVDVLLVSDDWWLERGDTNTTWKGNFYNSPADVFVAAFAECARREQYAKEQRERLEAAHSQYIREV